MNPNAQEASDAIGVTVSRILLNGEDVDTAMKALQEELLSKFQQ